MHTCIIEEDVLEAKKFRVWPTVDYCRVPRGSARGLHCNRALSSFPICPWPKILYHYFMKEDRRYELASDTAAEDANGV
jgi:hypothetical protein